MPKDRTGLTQRMTSWLQQHGISEEHKILVGVSGGNDSLVLAECLYRCGHPIEVAHVNYQLRGSESDGDADLVRAWCTARDVPHHELRAEMTGDREGVQSEARRIRYHWFGTLQAAIQTSLESPVFVATAHHSDDQAETVLLHLLRSADPMALAGMRSLDPVSRLIRPFLEESREALEEQAADWGLDPREDSSNQKPDYLRNRLRHEVLPLLESLRPGAGRHLTRIASRLQPLATESRRAVDAAVLRCGKDHGSSFELDLHAWSNEPLQMEVLHRLCRQFKISSKATPEIVSLTRSGVHSGARFESIACTVTREKAHLIWNPQPLSS